MVYSGRLYIKRILLFLIFILSGKLLFGQDDCVLKKSEDSLFVYTCTVADSKLKSIRANFIIHTSLSVMAAYLLDAANNTQWQYNTIEAQVLKRISPGEIIYRSEIRAPWPVSNRDLVMHLKVSQNPSTRVMTITLNSMADYIPEKPDVVRIPRAEGKYVVERINDKDVRVNYTFLVDPGGYVPAWLINMAIADGPFDTFKNLVTKLNSTVNGARASFIID